MLNNNSEKKMTGISASQLNMADNGEFLEPSFSSGISRRILLASHGPETRRSSTNVVVTGGNWDDASTYNRSMAIRNSEKMTRHAKDQYKITNDEYLDAEKIGWEAFGRMKAMIKEGGKKRGIETFMSLQIECPNGETTKSREYRVIPWKGEHPKVQEHPPSMVIKHERMRQVKMEENQVNIGRSEGARLGLVGNIIPITAIGGIVRHRRKHYSEADRVAQPMIEDGPEKGSRRYQLDSVRRGY